MATGYIMSYINAEQGFAGFNVSVNYYYGEDNHMDINRTPGKVEVDRYQ